MPKTRKDAAAAKATGHASPGTEIRTTRRTTVMAKNIGAASPSTSSRSSQRKETTTDSNLDEAPKSTPSKTKTTAEMQPTISTRSSRSARSKLELLMEVATEQASLEAKLESKQAQTPLITKPSAKPKEVEPRPPVQQVKEPFIKAATPKTRRSTVATSQSAEESIQAEEEPRGKQTTRTGFRSPRQEPEKTTTAEDIPNEQTQAPSKSPRQTRAALKTHKADPLIAAPAQKQPEPTIIFKTIRRVQESVASVPKVPEISSKDVVEDEQSAVTEKPEKSPNKPSIREERTRTVSSKSVDFAPMPGSTTPRRGRPRKILSQEDEVEPNEDKERKRTTSTSSSITKSPLHVDSSTEQESDASSLIRSTRKRRKPAAFEDYVILEEAANRPRKHRESVTESMGSEGAVDGGESAQTHEEHPTEELQVFEDVAHEEEATTSQTIHETEVHGDFQEEQVVDHEQVIEQPQIIPQEQVVEQAVEERVEQEVKPRLDISQIAVPRGTSARTRLIKRRKEEREELVDVVMDDVLDVVSGPLPIAPAKPFRPPYLLNSENFGKPPPSAAPLLVAGPPRGPPVKSPQTLLQTALPHRHKQQQQQARNTYQQLTSSMRPVGLTGRPPVRLQTPMGYQKYAPRTERGTFVRDLAKYTGQMITSRPYEISSPRQGYVSMRSPIRPPGAQMRRHPEEERPHYPVRVQAYEEEQVDMQEMIGSERVVVEEQVTTMEEVIDQDHRLVKDEMTDSNLAAVHDRQARPSTSKGPIRRSAADDRQANFVCMTDRGKVTLEPVNVNLADGTGPLEMYAFMDEGGRCMGYGNIDEEGNLVQQLDCPEAYEEITGETEMVEEQILEHLPEEEVVSEKDAKKPELSDERTHQDSESQEKEGPTEEKALVMSEETEQQAHTSPTPEDDDEAPPVLAPEVNAPTEEIAYDMAPPAEYHEDIIEGDGEQFMEEGVEYIEEADEVAERQQGPLDVRTVEFNFLDNKNICCGLCGEIVPYELLVNEHLSQNHPELLGEGATDLEEIPYEVWLRDKLHFEKKAMESGFRTVGYGGQSIYSQHPHTRQTRKVSQVRVCPAEMSLSQLEDCLNKKMIEKLGRRVKVTLVDKLHAQCGVCGSILSLNKKFEIMHLVRHFNAWHPTAHRCSGVWMSRVPQPGMGKPLNMQDFAVVDVALDAHDNLQCIWCGMFMGKDSLAMHYHEVHAEDIEVPKCRLCIEELVVNARLLEQFGEDFDITMPDELHFHCGKLNQKFASEEKLQKAIEKRVIGKPADVGEEEPASEPGILRNSRMQYGKRNKPKRAFVMPSYRQAMPLNSSYVHPLSDTQWQCKKCPFIIMAAVMSSGCIQHYKKEHPEDLDGVRYELCKFRLERISDGCMEFVHASLIECLMCQVSFALHKPYNMCRAIRHLQKKHSEMMPENHAGVVQHGYSKTVIKTGKILGKHQQPQSGRSRRAEERDEQQDLRELEQTSQMLTGDELAKFRARVHTDADYDQVRVVHMDEGPVYLLVKDGQVMDDGATREVPEYAMTAEQETGIQMRSATRRQIQRVERELYEQDANEYGHMGLDSKDAIIEADEELQLQYADQEDAPIPKEQNAFGRRLYPYDKYEELRKQHGQRPTPVDCLRRAVRLENEFVLEYFVPAEEVETEEGMVVMMEDEAHGDLVIEEGTEVVEETVETTEPITEELIEEEHVEHMDHVEEEQPEQQANE